MNLNDRSIIFYTIVLGGGIWAFFKFQKGANIVIKNTQELIEYIGSPQISLQFRDRDLTGITNNLIHIAKNTMQSTGLLFSTMMIMNGVNMYSQKPYTDFNFGVDMILTHTIAKEGWVYAVASNFPQIKHYSKTEEYNFLGFVLETGMNEAVYFMGTRGIIIIGTMINYDRPIRILTDGFFSNAILGGLSYLAVMETINTIGSNITIAVMAQSLTVAVNYNTPQEIIEWLYYFYQAPLGLKATLIIEDLNDISQTLFGLRLNPLLNVITAGIKAFGNHLIDFLSVSFGLVQNPRRQKITFTLGLLSLLTATIVMEGKLLDAQIGQYIFGIDEFLKTNNEDSVILSNQTGLLSKFEEDIEIIKYYRRGLITCTTILEEFTESVQNNIIPYSDDNKMLNDFIDAGYALSGVPPPQLAPPVRVPPTQLPDPFPAPPTQEPAPPPPPPKGPVNFDPTKPDITGTHDKYREQIEVQYGTIKYAPFYREFERLRNKYQTQFGPTIQREDGFPRVFINPIGMTAGEITFLLRANTASDNSNIVCFPEKSFLIAPNTRDKGKFFEFVFDGKDIYYIEYQLSSSFRIDLSALEEKRRYEDIEMLLNLQYVLNDVGRESNLIYPKPPYVIGALSFYSNLISLSTIRPKPKTTMPEFRNDKV